MADSVLRPYPLKLLLSYFISFFTFIQINNTLKMNKGVVKFYNETKGFGFIKEEDTDKEYFVHVSGLINKIKDNDEVIFDLEEGKKGINAVNVKIA